MADEDLNCPECGHPIPPTEIGSAPGTGAGGGNDAYQHVTCPECGAKLEREVESPADQWRLVPEPPFSDE